MKGNLSVTSNSFEKMYQNTYAASHTAGSGVVTMDGYHDPTERDNFIMTGSLVNELTLGSTTHTILAGFESIDTENSNLWLYNQTVCIIVDLRLATNLTIILYTRTE